MSMGRMGLVVAVACWLAIPVGRASADFVLLDDFNRADGAGLGDDWTSRFDGMGVSNNQAYNLPGYRLTYPLSTYDGVTANSVQADVFSNGNDVQYAALVLGHSTLESSVFIKVQNNGTSTSGFDRVAFYFGNNGADSGGSTVAFLVLDTPFVSGRMRATLEGNVATLQIDAGFTGNWTQTYSATYESYQIARLGTGVGIAARGLATLDNFGIVTAPVPEPGSLAMASIAGLVGLGALARRSSRKAA